MIKKIGLTLGKFAPMHVGHEALIVESLEIVDELYLLLYDCPDKTSIPLNIRAEWVRSAFADRNVKVVEGYDAPNRHEDTEEVRALQEDYIKERFKGVSFTHFLSSEYYGEHISKSLGAINVVLDKDRIKHGMTATAIRNNLWNYREKLSPNVYFDTLYKVAIIGGHDELECAKFVARYFNTILLKGDINLRKLRPLSNQYIRRQEFESSIKDYTVSNLIYDARDMVIACSSLTKFGEMGANVEGDSKYPGEILSRFDIIFVMASAPIGLKTDLLSNGLNNKVVFMKTDRPNEVIYELDRIDRNKFFS